MTKAVKKHTSNTKKPTRPRKALPLGLIRKQAVALGTRLHHLVWELENCELAADSLADQLEDYELAQKGGAA